MGNYKSMYHDGFQSSDRSSLSIVICGICLCTAELGQSLAAKIREVRHYHKAFSHAAGGKHNKGKDEFAYLYVCETRGYYFRPNNAAFPVERVVGGSRSSCSRSSNICVLYNGSRVVSRSACLAVGIAVCDFG